EAIAGLASKFSAGSSIPSRSRRPGSTAVRSAYSLAGDAQARGQRGRAIHASRASDVGSARRTLGVRFPDALLGAVADRRRLPFHSRVFDGWRGSGAAAQFRGAGIDGVRGFPVFDTVALPRNGVAGGGAVRIDTVDPTGDGIAVR